MEDHSPVWMQWYINNDLLVETVSIASFHYGYWRPSYQLVNTLVTWWWFWSLRHHSKKDTRETVYMTLYFTKLSAGHVTNKFLVPSTTCTQYGKSGCTNTVTLWAHVYTQNQAPHTSQYRKKPIVSMHVWIDQQKWCRWWCGYRYICSCCKTILSVANPLIVIIMVVLWILQAPLSI